MSDKAKQSSNGDGSKTQVHGYQEGIWYPRQPQTPEEFSQLLDNPDKGAQFQSAPPPEKLNPHLFPDRLP